MEYNSTLAGTNHNLDSDKNLLICYYEKFQGTLEFEDVDVGTAADKFGEDAAGVVSTAHQKLQPRCPEFHNQLVGRPCIQRYPPQAPTAFV